MTCIYAFSIYAPNNTLVSVGKLDDAGFDITFADGRCTICEQNGKLVSIVLKSGRGLYCVSHESDAANLPADVLTFDQFHC